MSVAERFWSKVDRNGPVHPVLGTRCWIWTACRKENGYGRFGWYDGSRRVMASAHRVVWSIVGQPLADGEFSLHRCDVKACVNVEHLFKGSQADNLADAGRKGRMARNVRGDRHPRAKLSAEAVAAIRSARPACRINEVAEVLAAEYGTSREYIKRLWYDHRIWKEG